MSEDKKRVFIIHGWSGSPDEGWLPWLKKELENLGFEVAVPAMPNSDEPKIAEWVGFIRELVDEPDKNTFFVGHSIGCQAVLRYLASIEEKAGGAVLVAPWLELKGLETDEEWKIAEPWLSQLIDFNKVKNATGNIICIFSDNDPFVPLDINRKLFTGSLNPKIIVESGKGHFSGDDGVKELPVVLESVLEISK